MILHTRIHIYIYIYIYKKTLIVFSCVFPPLGHMSSNFCERDSSPKILILSYFTHPPVVPNLYEFISSAGHKIIYFETANDHHWLRRYL